MFKWLAQRFGLDGLQFFLAIVRVRQHFRWREWAPTVLGDAVAVLAAPSRLKCVTCNRAVCGQPSFPRDAMHSRRHCQVRDPSLGLGT